MKAIKVLIAATALAGMVALTSGAGAQGFLSNRSGLVAPTQKDAAQTHLQFGSNIMSEPILSQRQLDMMTSTAVSDVVNQQMLDLPQITISAIADRIPGVLRDLAHGSSREFQAAAVSKGSIFDQKTVNVKVSFDPRPIGGILSIKVSIVPVFSGLNSASRPLATREFAQAVEVISEEMIDQTVTQLTSELSKSYAVK